MHFRKEKKVMTFSWIIWTLGVKEASQSSKKKGLVLCLTSSFELYLQKNSLNNMHNFYFFFILSKVLQFFPICFAKLSMNLTESKNDIWFFSDLFREEVFLSIYRLVLQLPILCVFFHRRLIHRLVLQLTFLCNKKNRVEFSKILFW